MSKSPPAGVAPPPGYHWDADLQGYVGEYHDAYNHTSQVVWHPEDGPFDASSFGTDRYTTVNGHKTLAGYWSDAGPHGTFVPFTEAELQDHVKKETADAQKSADKTAQKAGFHNAADQKAAQAKQQQQQSPTNGPNFGAGAAPNASPFDNFAAGTSADYSQSKIVTEYGQDLHLSSRADDANLNATSQTLEDTLKQFANSGSKNISKVQQQLINAGIGSSVQVNGLADSSTLAAYRGLLQNVLLVQSNGQQVTPDEWLGSLAKAAKPKTTTSTSVTLTNPAQAHQALTSAFGNVLGRKPNDAEVAAFTQAINTYEKANPTTTSTTTDASGNAITSQKTTDMGTGSASFVNDFAGNYAQTNPATAGEYHAAQALNFYNLALQTLGGGINTGNTT